MTSTAVAPDPNAVAAVGTPRLFAGVGEGAPESSEHHHRTHGALTMFDHDWLVRATADVGLRGRGGAAFPVTRKLAGTPRGRSTEVVVNLSEGEPASRKDRVLARLAPHLIIDGALTVAHALKTRRITIAVKDTAASASLTRALMDRRDARGVRMQATTGGFVSGEVRALLRGMDGGPVVPPGRRVLPTVAGLSGRPTFVSNAETFAHIGLIARHGTEWYAEVGSASERGTTLLTLIGDVPRPGVVEAPLGTSLERLVGSATAPVLIGGYHGAWVREAGDLRLDRVELSGRGLTLGAGVIARLPEDTCALGEVARVARWLAGESSGQCGPCFFGLPAVAADIEALVGGHLPAEGLGQLHRRLGLLPGRGACGHPDGAALFVSTALDVHQTEIAEHLARGRCGATCRGVLPLGAEGAA